MIKWLVVAKHLKGFLEAYADKDGNELFKELINYNDFNINIGSINTASTYPKLDILFDREEKENAVQQNRGIITLWLDFTSNTGSDDSIVEYEQSYYFVNQLSSVLLEWTRKFAGEHNNKFVIAPFISNVLSDGDVQRPIFMTRVILDIVWRA